MLSEIIRPKQIPGEPRRRWFSDDNFDLVVWIDTDDNIEGFQLCYNKKNNQHALTWHRDKGYFHSLVDDGEQDPGGYKQTPILLMDGVFSKDAVAQKFSLSSAQIDQDVFSFVYEKIVKCPDLIT